MKEINFSILLFVFTLTGILAQVWSHPDDSLILCLSFDEFSDRTVKDHSCYGNNGELVGNPTLVEGKFGKALKLNGRSDWVEIPHDDSLTVDESVTVMAWIMTPRHGGPKGSLWQSIVAKGNTLRSYSLYTEMEAGTLHLSISNSQGGISNKHVLLNRWQHVVAQVDNGIHRYWINGKPSGVFPIKASLPGRADTASVRVGNSHDTMPAISPDRHFLGLIDELRIWNRALSHDEIIREMEKGTQLVEHTEEASGSQQPYDQ